MDRRVLTKALTLVFCLCLLANLPLFVKAQYAKSRSVMLEAELDTDLGEITLKWDTDANADHYSVYRKSLHDNEWALLRFQLDGSAASFTDKTTKVGEAYEYRVVKEGSLGRGYGYMYTGIDVMPQEKPSPILLLVDSSIVKNIGSDLEDYEETLWRSGYTPVRILAGRSEQPSTVKKRLNRTYEELEGNANKLLIIGHVPVPYSGDTMFAPDGHFYTSGGIDHDGAWAADAYYADLDGIWTDNVANHDSATREANRNVPGDGKFDQTAIPSAVELEVGRIDMSHLPKFETKWSQDEYDLIRRYFRKSFLYRSGQTRIRHAGLVEDGFFTNPEAFASNGYRNFAPLVGASNVSAGKYSMDLRNEEYILSYTSGPGSYISVGSDLRITEFVNFRFNTIFTMLFGSFHGDWDSEDNIMRTALAHSGPTLTCLWAGRPHYFLHHMGLGMSIGHSLRQSQNNSAYRGINSWDWTESGFSERGVHMSLLGDPTLTLHVSNPINELTLKPLKASSQVELSWTYLNRGQGFAGYHIYRLDTGNQTLTKVHEGFYQDTLWVDSFPLKGENTYLVRPVQKIKSPSGSFYNLGMGGFANIEDIKPTHTTSPHRTNSFDVTVYPNPINDMLNLSFKPSNEDLSVQINGLNGQLYLENQFDGSKGLVAIPVGSLPSGYYVITIKNTSNVIRKNLVKF